MIARDSMACHHSGRVREQGATAAAAVRRVSTHAPSGGAAAAAVRWRRETAACGAWALYL